MQKQKPIRRFERSKGHKINPLFHKSSQENSLKVKSFLQSDAAAACGMVLGVFFLIWYTTIRSSFFYFSEITIDPTTYIPRDRLEAIVSNYLDSRQVFIFPARSYPYFSKSSLKREITNAFGNEYAIESVEVRTSLPRTLHIVIHERVPSVVWRMSNAVHNSYYMVDRDGVVAQYVNDAESLPNNLPIVTDANRTELTLGNLATSKKYIEFILKIYSIFTEETKLPIVGFEFPKIECRELQYVMEQIFEDEIADATSDEFKQRKLAIQQQFKNGELSIDQSLDALDAIKREEISAKGDIGINSAMPKIRWQQISVTVPCDYSAVSKELRIITQDGENTFQVYVDTQIDPITQLYNFKSSIDAKQIHTDRLEYFDARYEDRGYFKER